MIAAVRYGVELFVCLFWCSGRIPRLSLNQDSLYVGVVEKPLPHHSQGSSRERCNSKVIVGYFINCYNYNYYYFKNEIHYYYYCEKCNHYYYNYPRSGCYKIYLQAASNRNFLQVLPASRRNKTLTDWLTDWLTDSFTQLNISKFGISNFKQRCIYFKYSFYAPNEQQNRTNEQIITRLPLDV